MPNPVVSFEIRGADPARLRQFYSDAFGWQMDVLPGGYALLETATHEHNDSGTAVYTGEDAHMNEVVLGSAWAQPVWKYAGEPHWRSFTPGVDGGIGEGPPGVGIFIGVPDIEAALAAAVKHGGTLARERTEVAPNVFVGAFLDPEGNRIELLLQARPAGG